MPQVLTAREVQDLVRAGQPVPEGALLTPSARDFLEDHKRTARGSSRPAPVAGFVEPRSAPSTTGSSRPATAALTVVPAAGLSTLNSQLSTSSAPATPDYEFRWTPGSDPKTPAEIERFFRSEPIEILKRRICDIGRRLWLKDYTDGNGGNITIRVGDNLALCTPTLICKGFMTPEDMCLVDLDGNQLAGTRVRTSEAKTHFGIMKRQPAAKACVHAHPPHATAFAISNAKIPSALIPEAEVFLGRIGIAQYETPGTPANAEEVGRVGVDHQAVLMQNHGVIVWGKDVEDAYWKMENIDAYCRTIAIAAGLGTGLHRFGPDKLKDLIALRQKLGMPDPRANLKEAELCDDNSEFRPAVVCQTPAGSLAAPAGNEPAANPEVEALVQRLTEEILRQLQNK
ncbi:class II aldolase/adducin family protein [Opitutus terrae]|uniref:Class II aldolase/adducin family protein n=1 Tax=Opitutus terrae (strain DSM 11246 / JCM 15787 / PB90-1) TaxID=452637 RepID=B1ZR96_OPITP|nr:class II aldolase/adducin family protein [Opitutus terrae]ACB74583.1 class II aldolase/adducin family protein [Opitutus terrae PB90-1]